MEFKHTSVLLEQTLEALSIKEDGIYADGTLGGGGHALEICSRLGEKGTLLGIDRDKDAIKAAKTKLKDVKPRVIYANDNYADIKSILKRERIDGINGAVLDLGVSSFQLDQPERGFSYMQDAPLDMRMNQDDGLTAEVVVNTYSERDLTNIIKSYGEERWAARISQFIVKARKENRITSTGQLTDIIKAAIPKAARRDGPHPAKRTFQAIRIEVNEELSRLRSAVDDFIDVLLPGGRLCIITFHSLEDRIVKEAFLKSEDPCTCPKELPKCVCGAVAYGKRITRKPIIPTEHEILNNPRSRSAKLRVLEKPSYQSKR